MLRARLNQEEKTTFEEYTHSKTKLSKYLHLPSTTVLKSDSNFITDEKVQDPTQTKRQLPMLSPRAPLQLNTQSNMNLVSMLSPDQPQNSSREISI